MKPGSNARAVAADVIEILDALDGAGVAAWLDGGWAVDAAIGEQTRDHQDLDLIVSLDDVAAMRTALAGLGFEMVEGAPHTNFVLRDSHNREVDVHPVRFDETGHGVYRMENGEDWIFPAEAFTGRGYIGQREVRCLTPDVQMVNHANGYEPQETDFQDMRLLHERLGTELLGPYARHDGNAGDATR